jgi:prepilin-type N-terminal cleavage/methylation domain-containing protein
MSSRKSPQLPFGKRLVTAFTLVELLVVIVILAILAALAIPMAQDAILRSQKPKSLSNLRQLYQFAVSYAGDNNGKLPEAISGTQSAVSGNFFIILRDAGYIRIGNVGSGNPNLLLFSPFALKARKPIASTATSYAVNFWATGTSHGNFPEPNLGRLPAAQYPAQQAFLMDGAWNGQTWPVQIGRVSSELPDFLFPPSKVDATDPESEVAVIFLGGNATYIKRKDFVTDRESTFWKGLDPK